MISFCTRVRIFIRIRIYVRTYDAMLLSTEENAFSRTAVRSFESTPLDDSVSVSVRRVTCPLSHTPPPHPLHCATSLRSLKLYSTRANKIARAASCSLYLLWLEAALTSWGKSRALNVTVIEYDPLMVVPEMYRQRCWFSTELSRYSVTFIRDNCLRL